MNLTREKILAALADVLRSIVVFKGRPTPTVALNSGTNPAKALELDSDDLVLVGCELTDHLGVEVPEEVIDWVDDSSGSRRCRSLGEIADKILGYFNKQEAARG